MDKSNFKQMYVLMPIETHKILLKVQAEKQLETGTKKALPVIVCDIIDEYDTLRKNKTK